MNGTNVVEDQNRAAKNETTHSSEGPLAMPEAAMFGWLGEIARVMQAPLGWAYSACLTLYANENIGLADGSPEIRTTLYSCLLGAAGSGESKSIARARDLLRPSPEAIRTATPASDRGLITLVNNGSGAAASSSEPAPHILLCQDELKDVLAKIGIQGSSLAPLLCKFFYEDEGGSADKHGLHVARVKLSILGGLAVSDSTDFQALFGSGTTAGLYDRFILAPGPSHWSWDHFWSAPQIKSRRPATVRVTRAAYEVIDQWKADGIPRGMIPGRLAELALRIAVISASANGDNEVSADCLNAALAFAEWQFEVRKVYGPGLALNQDAVATAAILDAFIAEYKSTGEYRFLAWRDLANNKNFSRKFGSPMITRNRDALVASGHLELLEDGPKKGPRFYRFVPAKSLQSKEAGSL